MVVNYILLQKYQCAQLLLRYSQIPRKRQSVTFLEPEDAWILEHVWLREFWVGDCGPARARYTGLHTQSPAQSALGRAVLRPHQQNSAA